MEEEVGTWDSVLLENLSEDSFISNIHQRYKRNHIYTYIGTSVVAVNPYHHISEHSLDTICNYGSKGIFQLPPHIYGLTNLAFESLIDQKENQCIFLTGESGSGKTESFKMIVNFLTQIQEKSAADFTRKTASANNSSIAGYRSHTDAPYLRHRRNSSSCSMRSASNAVLYKNSTSLDSECAPTTTSQRRQSPTPASTVRRYDMVVSQRLRAESSDCYGRRKVRDKTVDFDFSRHKSIDNLSTYDNSVHTSTAIHHGKVPASPTIDVHPTKSCFRHHKASHCVTATSTKSTFSTDQLNVHASPKLGSSGCRQCGHSKCTRALSVEKDDHGSQFLKASAHLQRGSCSNLSRQYSTESNGNQDEQGSVTVSTPRISLYDIHKLNQTLTKGRAKQSPHSLITNRKYREPLKHLRECVSYADVFLEAMGNASTLRNNNASRYGKLFDVEIDFKGDPMGVHITHYMLEKTRITDTANGERNFHIFYQLLLGGDLQLLKSLKLYRNVEKYAILKNTTAREEDRTNFHYTKKSLEVLGLSCDEICGVFRVIAVVLKLGNFIFVPITNIDGTEGCQISNIYEVQETAALLSLEDDILINCLTRAYSSNNAQEDVGYEMDARQASAVRNTLCRTLYARLFTWLVNKINEVLKSTQREKNLALLDFFGFELLANNSFEQFTINYSAEKIHQYFINNVLRLEQELYAREGLEWTRLDYFDNESICELIDKPNYGILSIINELHLTTNEALLQRIQQCCAGHPNFMICGPNTMAFRIRHFANVVNYSICGFLEKNTDTLPKYVSAALFQSNLVLVQSLFPEGNPRRQTTKKPNTLSSNSRSQLQALLAIVKPRRAHYVFCIKPNECKQSRTFDMALVQHQVRYMSLMPLIHLCRAGHCFHVPHAKFLLRYKLLNSVTWPHYIGGNIVEGIAIIIRNLPLPSAEFTIGIKNVFIRSPRTVYELEQFRKARIADLAKLIQKVYRMYRARKLFLLKRHSQIVIANAWRTWRECRFGISTTGRRHLWSLYRVAREKYRAVKYQQQVNWAVEVIMRCYRYWKIRQYLLTIPLRLPPNTLSPLSLDWPIAPTFLAETSRLLRTIYHRWKCYIYRNSFDQTGRNRMREKVTASIIFKDRKAIYPFSVAHPFIGDYVRLRHNLLWRKLVEETDDQFVVFADIINKITRSSGKIVPTLLVISTSSLLLLDHRTLQLKYRVPATEIYRMSLSPYLDNIAVLHVRASDFGRKKGDFIFETSHVIEIVTKMFLVIQNATGKPPEIHISTEFEANFGQQTVIFNFKYSGMNDLAQVVPKITRKANRMEIIV